MIVELFANDASTTLNGAITNVETSLVVASAVGFPTTGRFRLRIDNEIIIVTAVAGTTFTVTRGAEGTSAAAHSNGANVYQIVTAEGLERRKFDGSWSPLRHFFPEGTAAPSPANGNFTVGTQFEVLESIQCVGGRFYWGTPNKTVKFSLYNTSTLLATLNVSVTTAGFYEAVFASPVSLLYHTTYRIAAYQTDGLNYPSVNRSSRPAVPFVGGPYIMWTATGTFIAGDGNPSTNSGSEQFPVEPVLKIV